MTTDTWFDRLASSPSLSPEAAADLRDVGFTLMRGPVPDRDLPALAAAYDAAMADPPPGDFRTGRTTARLNDLVNRGAAFDSIYVFGPLLAAAAVVIGEPFRLSTMLGRTLLPYRRALPLHVDCASDAQGWPLFSFILMVDDFTRENGATRFAPGSHGSATAPTGGEVQACGAAGTLILYNSSIWHEHGANLTDRPRRSIQGAFIRRTLAAAIDQRERLREETRARLSPLARYVLDVD